MMGWPDPMDILFEVSLATFVVLVGLMAFVGAYELAHTVVLWVLR